MKFSNRIMLQLCCTSTILISSIPSIYANSNAMISELSNAPITILDEIIDKAQKLLDETRRKSHELSTMINKGQIPSLANPKDATKNIKQFISFIQTLQNQKFVHIDPQTTLILLQINQDLIKHIEKSLQNGFVSFKPLDISLFISRKLSTDEITLELLEKEIKKNERMLKKLNNTIDYVGLKWYNLAYRKFDKYIIDPGLKYSVPSRTFEVGALVSLGLVFWWRFGNDSFKNNMPTFVNNFFGPPPFYDAMGVIRNADGPYTPQTPNLSGEMVATGPTVGKLGPVGKLENIISLSNRGFLPILAALGIVSYKVLMREWDHYQPKIVKNLSVMHNLLKGGAYVNRANQLDENYIQNITFDDIIGLDNVKEKFKLLVEYLKNPEPFDRLGLTPQKGCLLVGESRTGKTFSVKALANEIKKLFKDKQDEHAEFKYLEFNASEINKHGIQYLLSLVKEVAPCIVFIDEIDLLDLQRKGKNETLSEFLTCMSGTLDSKDPKNQVIIIAATNRPESLDVALRQPGRFGLELRFEYPCLRDRKALFERKLDKLSLNTAFFDLDKLAEETEGQSYEALNMIVDQALLKARISGEILSQQHLEEILNAEIRKIMPANNKEVPEYELDLLATHFAGHALALTLLETKQQLSVVTIKPVMTKIKEEVMGNHLWKKEEKQQDRYEYGQVFTNHSHDTINIITQAEQIKMCKYHLAGIVAEEMIFGSASYCCHKNDTTEALKIAQAIAFEGFKVNELSKHTQKDRHDKALAIIEQCKYEIRQILEQHKDILVLIIDELKKREILTAYEISALINPDNYKNNHEDISSEEMSLVPEAA
ncbi:MAG: AAA family ATPase [bacterium]|nr:AAA family ATPase [bacterium]